MDTQSWLRAYQKDPHFGPKVTPDQNDQLSKWPPCTLMICKKRVFNDFKNWGWTQRNVLNVKNDIYHHFKAFPYFL